VPQKLLLAVPQCRKVKCLFGQLNRACGV